MYVLEYLFKPFGRSDLTLMTVSQGVTSFLRLAWTESPGLAIQLATRFPSAKMQSDVRWLILNFPEKAIPEASALEIMLESSLPSDVNFQLKVRVPIRLVHAQWLANLVIVPTVLGAGQSHRGLDLLPARLRQPPLHSAVCHAGSGKSFDGCALLLCTTAGPSSAIRRLGLCRALHS